MNRYKINMTLGYHQDGSFYIAQSLEDGQKYLIEEHNKKCNTWEECISIRQVKALKMLSHPNIIKIKEIIREDRQLYLVFEYFETSLSQYYQSFEDYRQKINESQIKKIIYQIALAINQCHINGIMHRDLSTDNIYITKENKIKVGQFSNAEFKNKHNNTEYITSRYYRSPEAILKLQQSIKIDIWALGCIMGELYYQKPLFMGNSEIDQLMQILNVIGIPNHKEYPEFHTLCQQKQIKIFKQSEIIQLNSMIPQASPIAIDLMIQMLNINPAKRISIQNVLLHPFFKEYNQKFEQYIQDSQKSRKQSTVYYQSRVQSMKTQIPYNSRRESRDNLSKDSRQYSKTEQSSPVNSFQLIIPQTSLVIKTQENSSSQKEIESPINNPAKRLSKFGLLNLPKLSDTIPISQFSQKKTTHENLQQSLSDCESENSQENPNKQNKVLEKVVK